MVAHFDTINLEGADEKSGSSHVHLTGMPVTLTDSSTGITIIGNVADLVTIKHKDGKSSLESATVTGDAHIIADTSISDTTAKAVATKTGKRYIPPVGSQFTKLDSDTLTYVSTATEGTIDAPKAWTIHQDSKGSLMKKDKDKKDLHIGYVQTLDASGSSGHLVVSLDKNGQYDRPKTAHIAGPVKFASTRKETVAETAEVTTTVMNGTCDQVDLDCIKDPGTLTASGHVELDGDLPLGQGHTSCAEFVAYLDKDLKPIKYKASGSPANARVTPKDGSH